LKDNYYTDELHELMQEYGAEKPEELTDKWLKRHDPMYSNRRKLEYPYISIDDEEDTKARPTDKIK